jgi:hypothetical protein
VVALAGVERALSLLAASKAVTSYWNKVAGASPASEWEFVGLVAISTLSR